MFQYLQDVGHILYDFVPAEFPRAPTTEELEDQPAGSYNVRQVRYCNLLDALADPLLCCDRLLNRH